MRSPQHVRCDALLDPGWLTEDIHVDLDPALGQILRIVEEIEVMVFAIMGNLERIGVKARRTVEVHREDIYERIAAELVAVNKPSGQD